MGGACSKKKDPKFKYHVEKASKRTELASLIDEWPDRKFLSQ
jgi:hypothetical protein